jgi:hypothetical protein
MRGRTTDTLLDTCPPNKRERTLEDMDAPEGARAASGFGTIAADTWVPGARVPDEMETLTPGSPVTKTLYSCSASTVKESMTPITPDGTDGTEPVGEAVDDAITTFEVGFESETVTNVPVASSANRQQSSVSSGTTA